MVVADYGPLRVNSFTLCRFMLTASANALLTFLFLTNRVKFNDPIQHYPFDSRSTDCFLSWLVMLTSSNVAHCIEQPASYGQKASVSCW